MSNPQRTRKTKVSKREEDFVQVKNIKVKVNQYKVKKLL